MFPLEGQFGKYLLSSRILRVLSLLYTALGQLDYLSIKTLKKRIRVIHKMSISLKATV